jgi:galactose mutarotase-like enzyme
MIYRIRNECLEVKIDSMGAEPKSMIAGGRELFFQNTGTVPGLKISPVLFPVIGNFPNDEYLVYGEPFPIMCHGFVSSSEFSVSLVKDDSILFKLCSDNKTLSFYPFDFDLSVLYTLNHNTLTTEFSVINRSERTMPFAVGSHTAYALDFGVPPYYLRFEKFEHKSCYSVIGNDKLINEEKLMDGDMLELKEEFFISGAQTFSSLESKRVYLEDSTGKTGVCVDIGKIHYLTLWKRPKQPFICIEPWSCESAHYTKTRRLEEQKDIIMLPPGREYSLNYSITA